MDLKTAKRLYRQKNRIPLLSRLRHWTLGITGRTIITGIIKNLGGSFKQYIIEENMPQRLAVLKQGLDNESLQTINLAMDRILFCPEEYSVSSHKIFLSDFESVLTNKEWEDMREYNRILPLLRQKYPFPLKIDYFQEVFQYHSGLTLLPAAVQHYLSDKNFIDGGAFIGDTSLVLLEYLPHKIYAFDISEIHEPLFHETMRLNAVSSDKYEFIRMGLGERTETIHVNLSFKSGNETNLYASGKTPLEIVSIDDWVQKRKIGHVGLIKLDIEGMEFACLRGAVHTIQENNPVLAISIYHNPYDFFEIKPFLESICPNYTFMIRSLRSGILSTRRFLFRDLHKRCFIPNTEISLLAWPSCLCPITKTESLNL